MRKATRSLPVLSLPIPRPSRRTSRLSLMHVAFPVLVTGLALRLPRMAPRSFSTLKDITFTQLPRRNELRRRIPPRRIPPPRTPRPSSLPLSSPLSVPLSPSWMRPLLLVARLLLSHPLLWPLTLPRCVTRYSMTSRKSDFVHVAPCTRSVGCTSFSTYSSCTSS